MKRIVVACAVGILAVGWTAVGTGATHKSVTFHLVEKDLGFNFVDNPPRQGFRVPPLMGDAFTITSELQTRGGKHAGYLVATCTVAKGGANGKATCTGQFLLKGGTLALSAAINFAENNPGGDNIAIVGGTGVYEAALGSIHAVSRGDSPYTDDTVHILFP